MKYRNVNCMPLKKLILPALAAIVFATTLCQAVAAIGTGDIGGGASVCVTQDGSVQEENCNELFDVHMFKSRRDITKLPIYAKRIEPTLKKLEEQAPALAQELREALSRKRWYFSNVKIPELGKEGNGTDLKVKQRAVQYQDAKEVWIAKNWFDGQDEDGQAGIIFHELAMHIRLKAKKVIQDMNQIENPDTETHMLAHRSLGQEMSVNDVRALVELLLGDLPRAAETQKQVRDLNFGSFLTKTQKKELDRQTLEITRNLDAACKRPDNQDPSQSERMRAIYDAMKPFGDSIQKLNKRVRHKASVAEQIYTIYFHAFYSRLQEGEDSHSLMYLGYENGLPLPIPLLNGARYAQHQQVCKSNIDGTSRYNCVDGVERSCAYVKELLEARDAPVVPDVEGQEDSAAQQAR